MLNFFLRKLNNIQRVEYAKKFKTFTFKTAFSAKKSIITITLKTRIIIITFIKFITSIIFVKGKVDDAKNLYVIIIIKRIILKEIVFNRTKKSFVYIL